jgi:ABC-type Fe3+ transport system permease subunit
VAHGFAGWLHSHGIDANQRRYELMTAINGEYDQQKGAALSLVLLLPTLTVFVLQRYWLSRRSYVTVTGKPASRTLPAAAWYVRWPCIGARGR